MTSHGAEKRHGRRWLRAVTAVCTVVAATAVGMVVGISSAQAIIPCDTLISGGKHPGFTVTSGSVCVEGATITGSITVTNGADIFIGDGSLIKGSLSATAANQVLVCDSTLASVSVTQTIGIVSIGKPSECGGNHIQGGLTVALNNGGGAVECNKIGGSWLVSPNTPTISDFGNHHKGTGPLTCRGNTS